MTEPLLRVRKTDRPVLGRGGVDLHEARAPVPALLAVGVVANAERLVLRAHETGTAPLAAAIVIDRVDVDIAAWHAAPEQGLAALCGKIPPALRRPSLGVLIA